MKIDYFNFKNSNSKIKSIKQLLLGLVMMLSVSIAFAQEDILITTTSTDANWSINFTNSGGAALTWLASGTGLPADIPGTGNNPTFNFSANDGSPILITISSSDNFDFVTVLLAPGRDITDVDFANMENIRTLEMPSNALSTINLTANTALERLELDNNDLGAIDISANVNLTTFDASFNDLITVDVAGIPNLTFLDLSNNELTAIDLNGNNQLAQINLDFNLLTTNSIGLVIDQVDAYGTGGFGHILSLTGNPGDIPAGSIDGVNNLLSRNWIVRPPVIYDFGDAPNSYGTDIASSGPQHIIGDGDLYLGSVFDDEFDAISPGLSADGDDNDKVADEDGVDPLNLVGITTSTDIFSVDVDYTNNTTLGSNIYAWIDFDRSGTFDDDEFTTAAIPNNSTGTVTLTWSNLIVNGVDIVEGDSNARFRTTSDILTGSDTGGIVNNGEVEDYFLIIQLDTDKDGVPDSTDLDADNDGILNTDEVGDTNGNGIDDMLELDSDDDTCLDVTEAGYIDGDGDGILGTSPVVVDSNGLITDDALGPIGGNGFATPNDLDINGVYDFQEAGTAASITTDPVDQDFILAGSATFTATAVADTYQWEVSIDGGANWTLVANDANNAGADTNTLTVSNLTIDVYYNNTYRLVAEYVSYACDIIPAESAAAGFNPLDDFDGDLVPDIVDLDADNDGILNTDEVGDSNGNGTDDIFELDSDGDGCFDTLEAGVLDGDEDGIVGTGVITDANVDADGLVISDANGAINSPVDAYGPLNDLDINGVYDFQEEGFAASITTDPVDQDFILAGSATFTATAVADTYQWEVSIDGGANWTLVANDANNAGADTNTLTVSNLTIDVYYNNTYRLVAEYVSYACDIIPAESAAAGFNPLDDFDGDLVPDIVDLDADNDGILNTDEVGDSNGNGTDDIFELDADGDGCFDTLEAGVLDGDEDGIVGTGVITDANVDADGLVISDANGAINSPADAYGPLNDLNSNSILDSQELGVATNITTQPVEQEYVQGGTAVFTVITNLVVGDGSYIWEEDSGAGFMPISDGPDYSGTDTANLTVNIPNDFTMVFNTYRVIVSNVAYYCDPTATSVPVGFVIPGDFDKDGVFDVDDLDDDNDGILDVTEDDGQADRDTDGDGFPDKRDFDADGDGCFDTLESGVLDGDSNGLVGTGIITDANVDADGLVISDVNGAINSPADAYGPLNNLNGSADPDFQEEGFVASITTDPVDQDFVLAGSATFTATAVADTYQWEVSTDGGTNWNPVVNDANNAGADTDALTVSNLTIDTYNNNTYRLIADYISYVCDITPAVSLAAGFNALDDFDGDTVPDVVDLDADNDGILDVNELVDSTPGGNGILDRFELDSDADGCFDTLEAGVIDGDQDGIVGTGAVIVDLDGLVISDANGAINSPTDAYGPLDDKDASGTPDFQEAGAVAAITTQPEDQNFIPGDPATFTVVATADTYAWEESTDGGLNWSLVSGANYTGEDTPSLTILSTDISMINYEYRVLVNNIAYACDLGTYSDAAVLVSLPDNDNDGVPDVVDVDDDNDGIFDTDEQDALGADIDSNGNSVPDRFELDSDSDGCDDVTEAFTDPDDSNYNPDPDGDGYLGTSPVSVNPLTGQVISGTDGYTTPNDLDNNGTYDFQEAGTVASITSSPVDQEFILGGSANFTAASDGDTYQWEISADGVNFTPLTDDGKYSGTNTENLTVSGLVIPDYFNEYRVVASNIAFVCDPGDASDSASYNILIDTDNDGVFDIVDVDDDNDGIFDTVEGEFTDSNLDGIPDRISLDSDGDSCADVREALTDKDDPSYDPDPDGDGVLGSSPVSVDADGQVIGQGGYTAPNDLDNNGVFDFQEAGSPSNIENQPEDDEIALGEDALFEVTGNATFYQWQESMDGGNSWFDLSNDDKYSGVDTDRLRIAEARGRLEGNMYRVVLTSPDFACDPVAELISVGVRLIFNTSIIPDGFSPNGDGINDVFSIPGLIETPNFTMEVFDRWGNSVYKYANNGNLSPDWWDGLSTGNMTLSKGQLVPAGTYFYLIEYNDGNMSPDKGYVYINY